MLVGYIFSLRINALETRASAADEHYCLLALAGLDSVTRVFRVQILAGVLRKQPNRAKKRARRRAAGPPTALNLSSPWRRTGRRRSGRRAPPGPPPSAGTSPPPRQPAGDPPP